MPNTFKIGDKVKTVPGNNTPVARINGTVKYIACQGATTIGGKTCSKVHCPHLQQDYVWVNWIDSVYGGVMYSYHYTDLAYDNVVQPVGSVAVSDEQKQRDAYIEETKEVINKVVESKKQIEKDFYDKYNGFTTTKYDRFGRPFIHEEKHKEKPQLTNEELTPEFWQRYTGKT
jgi:hypothetical protein